MNVKGYALQYFERSESLVDIDYPDRRHLAHRAHIRCSLLFGVPTGTITLSTL
jgi:hypothetical protein